MADELDRELRHALGVPVFLEGEDGEHQVDVVGDLVHAALIPRPELRRHVTDDLRLPLPERAAARCVVSADGLGEAQVETGIVDQHDNVRFAPGRQLEQVAEQAAKLEVVFEHLPDADHGVLAQVELRSQRGRLHLRAARADEVDLVAARFGAHGLYQLRTERVAAGFAGNQQDGFASVTHQPSPKAAAGSGRSRSISSSR